MKTVDLSGLWRCEAGSIRADIRLPGTLDQAEIGLPDDPLRQWKAEEVRRIGFWREGDPIVTRLTRKHRWTGEAAFTRQLNWKVPPGKRIFAECGRGRKLRLLVNGREAPAVYPVTLSTPAVFEITGLAAGEDELRFLSDNGYAGWPAKSILYSSAASDETQTNWNGLLGYLRLRIENPCFISGLRVYPREDSLTVRADLDLAAPWKGVLRLRCPALTAEAAQTLDLPAGKHTVSFEALPLRPEAERWDIGNGALHTLTALCDGLEPAQAVFGLREFAPREGRLTLNGRPVFLRGETNCAVFPRTGFPPMDRESWRGILETYRSYGVNCLRFHSHCPPEAAFAAADELGMLMQPELSHWNPEDAFASPEARDYYQTELHQILRRLANHPSFVMLTLGNELQADGAGHGFMDSLLKSARAADPTRLYANGSNPHYGELEPDAASDFYTAMTCRGLDMRATCDGMTGWLNNDPPDARHGYDEAAERVFRESGQPVFSFEVGQYEVLPDFDQIDAYAGVTSPENLRHIRRKAEAAGLLPEWKRWVEASGESALLCYRAEAEAALRTAGYSGISLLGLQDFPGQGTALVGMLDANLQRKPYPFAAPERFSAFFRDALPLALLPRFTWTAGEEIACPVRMANYGRADLTDRLRWRITGEGAALSGEGGAVTAPAGGLTEIGALRALLPDAAEPLRLRLRVAFGGAENEYPLWVYPDAPAIRPEGIYECRAWDREARRALAEGGCVYLSPESTAEALPNSIPAQFSPDFWSVCTFPHQAGGMGQLIDEKHPLFRRFPTEAYSNWQWWPMANRRAMILPERIDCIIAEMDSYAFLRPMAKLFECRCGGGRLMVSSMGLQDLQQYPEARALQRAIYAYMASDAFRPRQELAPEWIGRCLMRSSDQ